MRINDVVTPEELKKIFDKELYDIKALGQRHDLARKYVDSIAKRLSADYVLVVQEWMPYDVVATQCLRLLALLDRFLEEKYANNSTTN